MTVEEAIDHNRAVRAEGGPRLTAAYRTFVAARDRARQKVLVGGLGAMGVGRMWFDERQEHAALPGFADAPGADSASPIDPTDEIDRERAAPGG